MIFFDLDGCTVDFVRPALKVHNAKLAMPDVRWDFDKQIGIDPTTFWASLGREFWANLPVLEDGMLLFDLVRNRVGDDNVLLLSSPCKTDGCLEGKRDWVKKHLPAFERKLILCSRKAAVAGKGKVLFDDSDVNCDEWNRAGGWSVTVPRPWNCEARQCDENGSFNVAKLWEEIEWNL